MRTERRQELRTNELSYQLDEVVAYAKRNATWLTVVVVGAAILTGAGFTYAKWQRDRRAEAWTIVGAPPADDASVSKTIQELDGVVAQNLAPNITAAALLRTAETAMRERIMPAETAAGESPSPTAPKTDWAAKARGAYEQILREHAEDPIATAAATIGLGVLAEDEGRYADARENYNKIVSDPQYASLPAVAQARYRLEHLDRWSKAVVFPKPQMTVDIPRGMEAEAFTVPPPETKAPDSATSAPANSPVISTPGTGAGGAQ